MTNEEAERMMQFILEHQAQTAINLELTSEKVDKLAAAQLKYEARTGRLEESFLILVNLAQSTDERMDEFDEKMKTFSDKMNGFSDKMNVLIDAQMRTDEIIRKLAAVVDRYYSEGHNGKT